MAHLLILVHATADAAVSYGTACAAKGLDVDVLPVLSPHDGMSAAYDALARECLAGGRVLPGLLRRFRPPRQRYDSIWLACWSAGYALARALRPADRDEVAGLVLLDSGHTVEEADGTPLDAGVEWLVAWAIEAREDKKTLWIAPTDVDPVKYASTADVAREVEKLAGGQAARFRIEHKNLYAKDRDEHVAALRGWGPAFVAEAMASAIAPGAPPWKTAEPVEEPETQRKPGRAIRKGDRGDDVMAWTKRLLDLGYDPGAPDGIFGRLVDAATRAFQSEHGLVVDGVVGPKTRTAAELARPKPRPPAAPKDFAAAFLAQAIAELATGIVETAPNYSKRIQQMLAAAGVTWPDHWCAAFVTDCIRKAAAALGIEPPVRGSAGALALMAQFKPVNFITAAELLKNPGLLEPGQVGFWTRGEPGSGKGHTAAIATRAAGTLFGSIDGNGGPKGDRLAKTPRDLRDPRFLGVGRFV